MSFTTVHLTKDEALSFISFQKHYSLIQALNGLGGFDITNGSVEIHFDSIGKLAKIDIHRHYRLDKDGVI